MAHLTSELSGLFKKSHKLETEIKELAMQVALLKDENSELENMLNSKTKEENTNI